MNEIQTIQTVLGVTPDGIWGDKSQAALDALLQRTGRKGRVTKFNRRKQSVWSLVGAFLKLWGHTSHSPKEMSTRVTDERGTATLAVNAAEFKSMLNTEEAP